MSEFREPPGYIASSIRTAQSIAHHRLYELGDESHAGEPALCRRPLCVRLRSDADQVDALAAPPRPDVPTGNRKWRRVGDGPGVIADAGGGWL